MARRPKEHTAHFLISNFLMSKDSRTFKLNGNAQAVLRYMGDVMDATYNKGGLRRCSITQSQIANFSGVHRNTAATVIKNLLALEILIFIKKLEDNVAVYAIGQTLHSRLRLHNHCETAVAQNPQTVAQNPQNGCTTTVQQYNTAFNTDINPPVVEPETQEAKEAKEKMRKALGYLVKLKSINS